MSKLDNMNAAHNAFLDDAIALLKKHGEHVDAKDMLGLAAHLVGQLVAQQDPSVRKEEIRFIVGANIDQGVMEARQGFMQKEAHG